MHCITTLHNVDTSKYTIDGEKTASAIFCSNIPIQGNNKKAHCLVVGSLANNNHMFVFTFTADPRKFDGMLPEVEYMIECKDLSITD